MSVIRFIFIFAEELNKKLKAKAENMYAFDVFSFLSSVIAISSLGGIK